MKLPKELREKKDLKGTVNKGKKCSVSGCYEPAIRSLTEKKFGKYVEKAGFKVDENRMHKIYLCKAHYKESNKVRKNQDKIYQKKGFLDDSRALKKGSWDFY